MSEHNFCYELLEGISDDVLVIANISNVSRKSCPRKTVSILGFTRADDVGVLDFLDANFEGFIHFVSLGSTSIDDAWEKFKTIVDTLIE